MSLFKKTEEFWIMFDTSQYPAYYRDVHDLISAPRGFVLRYQYREDLLSDSARTLAAKQIDLPVLLIYVQKDSPYKRQENKSIPNDENAKNLIVLTRLARIINVVKQGTKYYFDFQVDGYPNNAFSDSIQVLLAPLIEKKEIPWSKWVTTSTNKDVLKILSDGSDEDNWKKIVEELGREPMQFASDAFWRLNGPFTRGGRRVEPNLRKLREEGDTRRIRAEYDLGERTRWRFQLISSTPKGIANTRPEYSVQVKSTESEKVKIIGSAVYELRHYDEKPIEYISEEMSPFQTASADILFQTDPTAAQWTAGAKLELRHNVHKSHFISVVGVICGIAGLVAVVFGGSKLFENDALNGAIILVLGGLVLVAAKYMLTGKLEFGK